MLDLCHNHCDDIVDDQFLKSLITRCDNLKVFGVPFVHERINESVIAIIECLKHSLEEIEFQLGQR